MNKFIPILFANLAILCPLVHAQTTERARPPAASQEAVWFHQLAPAKPVSIAALEHAAETAFAMLRGRPVQASAFQTLKTGQGPRMAFASISDGKNRAWVVYASGDDFPDAVANAIRQFKSLNPPLDSIRWLKLDLVQDVKTIPNFHMQMSPAPGPGFRGFAFSPNAQFAFLPEQLLFSNMYLANGRLDVGNLGNLLLNRVGFEVLGTFKQLLLYNGTQPIFSFGTQDVFTDGVVTLPLYRGHRFHGPVNRGLVQQAARDNAMFLLRNCSAQGRFPTQPSPWLADAQGAHSNAARALAAWTLARYGRIEAHAPSQAAAARILKDLKNDVKPVEKSGEISALVDFPKAHLMTNAVAAMAALELEKTGLDTQKFQAMAVSLGHFILYQMQPDGSLLEHRFVPDGDFDVEYSVDSSAAAIVALIHLYEKTDDQTWMNAAKRAMRFLLDNDLDVDSMSQLPNAPWVLTAMNAMYTYERDERLEHQTQRLALALTALQKFDVVYADLFGAYDNRPTTSQVAALTPHLVNAAGLLDEAGFGTAASDLMQSVHLNLVFQLQAQMREETVMFMPGTAFLGAFRDDVRTSFVSLTTQALQLAGLTETLQTMRTEKLDSLPMSRDRINDLRKARKLIYRFGRGLPTQE